MEAHTKNIKLVPIGNSRGIRLPKKLLQKYGFKESVILEETTNGILLKAKKDPKFSWEDTFREMANENENWDDFDTTLLEGLEEDETSS